MINKLPNNISEFSNFVEHPFCIFEKKNFLPNYTYKLLRSNFPDEKIFPGYHQQGKKIFFNNKHKEFENFIKGNIWEDFYRYFNNKDFVLSLIRLIHPQLELIENRKNFKNFKFNKKSSNNFLNRLLRKLFKLINHQTIRVGFEFSIIKKDCFIPPHCDTENKLLSLMIYFPPEKKLDLSKEYLNLGTNFYDKKSDAKKNLDIWQSKYLDNENLKNFYDNYKVFYSSKFEENKLVGFIKNDKSWHDVSVFNQDLLRKSLNINLFLE
ncbi:hypothetical protein OAC14_02620 [Candidatus Pelagibacter sp.]|nr:hypothetical protein [Candidatus Pelagibacter sp.]